MLKSFGRIWSSSGKFRIGFSILVILIILGLIHPLVASIVGGGQDPLAVGAYDPWEIPNLDHWLGTDRYGRDLLVMTLTGLEISLEVAAIAGLLSTLIGVVIAFVAGYKGGTVDGILNTTTDMFLVVPS